MDKNAEKTLDLKIERTRRALEANNMQTFKADNFEQAVEIVRGLLKKGDTISCGGSVTLKETGIADLMSCGDYNFLDRSKAQTPEEIKQIYRDTFSADAYITSANAVTETGELYNVDGNSNRVAAVAFGPDKVIVVVGANKIVKDLDEAVKRVKTQAAPPNTMRLDCDTPCAKTGECVSLAKGADAPICAGCRSSARICCNYLISAYQRDPDRIKVVIIKENAGF